MYHDGSWEGRPVLPALAGAAQLRASGNSSGWYTAYSSLGRRPISFSILALASLVMTQTHGIIKMRFGKMNVVIGNMNVVFGSEAALFGFREYIK